MLTCPLSELESTQTENLHAVRDVLNRHLSQSFIFQGNLNVLRMTWLYGGHCYLAVFGFSKMAEMPIHAAYTITMSHWTKSTPTPRWLDSPRIDFESAGCSHTVSRVLFSRLHPQLRLGGSCLSLIYRRYSRICAHKIMFTRRPPYEADSSANDRSKPHICKGHLLE